jgi:Flp pilus assembly protein TadG
MIILDRQKSWHWADDRGATAVEFALISPLMVVILIGIMGISLMLLSIGSMHFAVEAAARCASVNQIVCNSPGAVVAYANSRYSGAFITPVFTYSTAACGNQVSASITYTLNVGMFKPSVPLSATSCFP